MVQAASEKDYTLNMEFWGRYTDIPSMAKAQSKERHRLNWYVAHRVPSLSLASSFTTCLNREVLEGMFPWRSRYP